MLYHLSYETFIKSSNQDPPDKIGMLYHLSYETFIKSSNFDPPDKTGMLYHLSYENNFFNVFSNFGAANIDIIWIKSTLF